MSLSSEELKLVPFVALKFKSVLLKVEVPFASKLTKLSEEFRLVPFVALKLKSVLLKVEVPFA